ncbi:YlxR family protein [Atopobacter sp. AH10]|uniref:RNase P modulator RnpM n=1 Tax=Atopobacter sp. AH10 TaxID=2315861 RepID=UPI000EF1F792|nr:YlxR family protein [Atopobacter sp. AH10]RLK62444.1 YlxR family protein [Atopobacter sp. AH10]
MVKNKGQKRKVPMRKCVVTNSLHPKKELVRIVRQSDQTVAIDPSGKLNGRGAYIALDPALVAVAKEKRIFERQLEVEIREDFYDELYAYLDHQKARKELFENEQIR